MKRFPLLLAVCLSVISLFAMSGCDNAAGGGRNETALREIADSRYAGLVSRYSSGLISSRDNIVLKFAKDVELSGEPVTPGLAVPDSIVEVSPVVDGLVKWTDNRTIEVEPSSSFSRGQKYVVKANLSALFEDTPEDLSKFAFEVKVIDQQIDFNVEDVIFKKKGDEPYQTIVCSIETSDDADNDNIERLVSIKGTGPQPVLSWQHNGKKNRHTLYIKNLPRKENSYTVTVKWNGSAIGSGSKGSRKIEVAGLSGFKFLDYGMARKPSENISLRFSSTLMPKQNLTGLVRVKGDPNAALMIEGNKVKVFPSSKRKQDLEITVDRNIVSADGNKLDGQVSFVVSFVHKKPEVAWLDKKEGILPGTTGYIVPFKAVSLKAVDVTLIEIFEDNIVNFFHDNRNFASSRNLKRVGRPVFRQTISLIGKADNLYEWNNFYMDFSKYFTAEPGRFYQIRLTFRRSQSLYVGTDGNADPVTRDEFYRDNWDAEKEASNWSYYQNRYYNWSDRNDPDKDAYYNHRKWKYKNLMASDFGMIVKGSAGNTYHVFIANLQTTDLIQGVTIEAYNYQKQLVGTAKTDEYGTAVLECENVPFVMAAMKGEDRGYIRVDSSSSLSLANFDVGGTKAMDGIKGFLYGDRGVWRPGDTVYLTFILEDGKNTLPPNYPVVFELRDPRSQLVKTEVAHDNYRGFFDFTFSTDKDAITGNYTAYARVGGKVFSKTLKIETVKPNRLKVELDFGKESLTAADKTITGILKVNWLTGLVGKNLKYEYDVILQPINTVFQNYLAYNFDDASRKYSPKREEAASGTTDQDGEARFKFRVDSSGSSPGALRALFTGKIYEPGGNFSVDSKSIPCYPYESFVGVNMPPGDAARGMLLTDTDHTVQVASVDAEGNPVSRKDIEVSIYKLKWKWWWDQSANDPKYIGLRNYNPVKTGSVDTVNGKGSWKFRINYPSWGRYYIRLYDPVSGHSSGEVFYIDWPGWAGSSRKGDLDGASMLLLFADKKEYNVGENVKVTIPAAAEGGALVSIETGDSIEQSFWMKTTEGQNTFNFKATRGMTPSAYIHVTLVQPHDREENDLPLRLYGIVPIAVVDSDSKLDPVITMPDVVEPESNVSITVKEKDGNDMVFTLAMVDEGLLDITNYDTPRPWDTFYAKESLGVKTWDLYDEVLGPADYAGNELITIGGGTTKELKEAARNNRFEPVVKFFPPFYLSGGASKTYTFKMPRYIGSVKVMVVAAYDGSYGHADTTAYVKKSLMVLGTLPRVLGPGENVIFPVNVFNSQEGRNDISVKVSLEGAVLRDGALNTVVSFPDAGDKFVYFKLKTPEETGRARIKVTASADGKTATWDTPIEVRAPNPLITDVYSELVDTDDSWEYDVPLMGIDGTNAQALEVSTLPPVNLQKRLKYLIRYPHGCIEQTTSSVFPQLFLQDLTEITDSRKTEIQNNIDAGIERISTFQTASGGFSYWPGSGSASHWGSTYAGHFLVLAQQAGYAVSDELLSNWAGYQEKAAREWDSTDKWRIQLNQAYRLYTLALYGQPEISAMNRLRADSRIDNRAMFRLALAYAAAGKASTASDLAASGMPSIKSYKAGSRTYGSAVRDKAMVLETYAYLGMHKEGFKLFTEITEALGQDTYLSTQTIAYALLGVAMYGQKVKDKTPVKASYAFDGISGSIESNKLVGLRELVPGQGRLTVKNTSKAPIYVRFINQGIPLKGRERDEAAGLDMEVTYRDPDGKRIENIETLKQGTNFVSHIKLKNTAGRGEIENIALTMIVPSGWEIINPRLRETQGPGVNDAVDYQDVRDDRVLTYLSLDGGETVTISTMLNAAYLGDFYLPGINCEAMYDDDIYARAAGGYVSVVNE